MPKKLRYGIWLLFYGKMSSMKIALTPSKREELEIAYNTAKDKRTANKVNSILLLDDGYSSEEVASILRLDQSTVGRLANSYLKLGVTKFLNSPFKGRVPKLNKQQLLELDKYVQANLCTTTDEIVEHANSHYNVEYTRSGMTCLLKRLGFVYKKPVLIPEEPDPEVQEAFIDYYNQIVRSMGRKDKIYFLDGVHPQHNTVAACGWIKKGQEKQLQSKTGRQRVNLNGALDPQNLEVIVREDDTLNSESTIKLFKMIEERNPDDCKIALIADNARYYFNGDVVDYINKSKKLELIHLPPYCPNLNLIERVWKFMKRKVLHNKYYASFESFKAAIGDFFQQLPNYEDLEDLISEEFQIIKPCPSG